MPLFDRPTGEIIILIFAFLLALVVLMVGTGIIVLSILHPDRDQTAAISALGNLVAGLTGAVLGFLAGRGRRGRD